MRSGRIFVTVVAIMLVGAGSAYLLWSPSTIARGGADMQQLHAQIEMLQRDTLRLTSELQESRRRSHACIPEAASAGQPVAAPDAVAPTRDPGWKPPELSLDLSPKLRLASVRLRNGQLFQELGLDESQIAALVPVLGQQEERLAAATRLDPRTGRPPNPAELFNPERDQVELEAVLGRAKAAQFASLRKTLPARSDVRRIRSELEQAGEPITDVQERLMLAKVSARSGPTPIPPVAKESLTSGMERIEETRRERAQQLREELSSVLSPPQLARYDEQAELRAAYDSASRSSFVSSRLGSSAQSAGSAADPPVKAR
jgi:hypothetical protein